MVVDVFTVNSQYNKVKMRIACFCGQAVKEWGHTGTHYFNTQLLEVGTEFVTHCAIWTS